MICGPENEAESFRFALRSATGDGNHEAVAQPLALGDHRGPNPLTIDRIGTCRRWAQYYGGLFAHGSDFGTSPNRRNSPYFKENELQLIATG